MCRLTFEKSRIFIKDLSSRITCGCQCVSGATCHAVHVALRMRMQLYLSMSGAWQRKQESACTHKFGSNGEGLAKETHMFSFIVYLYQDIVHPHFVAFSCCYKVFFFVGLGGYIKTDNKK